MDNLQSFHCKKVHGIVITDELLKELSDTGRTQVMTFRDRLGKQFLGHFEYDEGNLNVVREAKYLGQRCPKCGGRILITSKGYFCENCLKEKPTCRFHCNGILSHRFITPEEVDSFLSGHPTIIDGCFNSMGHVFSAVLTEDEIYGITLSSVVGKCPVCGGEVLVSPVAFNCSSYQKCGEPYHFSIWRHFKGYSLSLKDVHELLTIGKTSGKATLYNAQGHISKAHLKLAHNKNGIIPDYS